MASKQTLSEEADCYVVTYEEDGFPVVEVRIHKPCPLREIMQRAERVMTLRAFSPRLPLDQKVSAQEAVESQVSVKERKPESS